MTDQQQKALRLLGLARRARLLEIGEEPVGIVCRSGKAKLLLVAKDAGDHTFRRARSFVSGSKLGDPGHDEILTQLTVQTQRVLKRRQEAQAHRKNVKTGKK